MLWRQYEIEKMTSSSQTNMHSSYFKLQMKADVWICEVEQVSQK